MNVGRRGLARGFKKLSAVVAFVIVGSLMLGRCAFEGGAFSSQSIKIPDEVALSSILEGNEGNSTVDAYVRKAMKQLEKACWQSGWRWLVRTLLWTGPNAISVEVTDSLLGSRTMTVACSKL